MQTKVYKSYKHFLKRKNHDINGVDAAHAKKNKNYREDNTTNVDCWNCVACRYCDACSECRFCDACTHCYNCTHCEHCLYCHASCVHCYYCTQCNTCVHCLYCEETWYCRYCKNCSLVTRNCEYYINNQAQDFTSLQTSKL